MLVLLPPSEGKLLPSAGPPLDLSRLGSPELLDARERVLEALVEACSRPDGPDVLGVGPSLHEEVARNRHIRAARTAQARQVYTGVLYAAAGLDDLDAAATARADDAVRTISALFGVVRPDDPITAYRLSIGTALPGLGRLARFWRPHLAAVLERAADGGLVVDCRSADYVAAWPAPAAQGVAVRVLRDVGGRRVVVSHWAKHARGALVRHLVTRRGPDPATPEDLVDVARELVGAGPVGPAAPGLMTSEVVDVGLSRDGRGTALSLVVAAG